MVATDEDTDVTSTTTTPSSILPVCRKTSTGKALMRSISSLLALGNDRDNVEAVMNAIVWRIVNFV